MSNWEKVDIEIDGWMPREQNVVLSGLYVGFKTIKTKKYGYKLAFLIRTEKEMSVIPAGQEAKSDDRITVAKGAVVALLGSGGTRAMEDIRVGTRVAVKMTGYKDVGKGNDMAVYSILRDKSRLGTGPTAELAPPLEQEPRRHSGAAPVSAPEDDDFPDDDDIPF